ncbi:MAG: drug resistance transporter, EmrB/QacA subfamily, partial [Thermoleophilia bacterium]|nr:drug resistance transporter, EmrB/QacA subfamily [Thermoleophilia bacterium]
AQLMVILDATIVNIALPTAQRDLGFSDDSRQWIITAYALAFGSLLLLGGRIGDLFGRKWVFLVGLAGFGVASAVGGAAGNFEVLVIARAAQGLFGALLAPAGLSLLSTTFTNPSERNKAFGIYGAIGGTGGAIGLMLGGVLTEYLSWRWCMYVNIVLAVPAVLGVLAFVKHAPHPDKPRLDIPGTIAASAGLFALVYGVTLAEQDGWGAGGTIGFLTAAVVLLVAFVVIQTRTAHPLLPMRVILDRSRGGAYLAIGIVGAGMFGVFLFLTYYMQQMLGYSPLKTGFAFLPMIATVITFATVATSVLFPRMGARNLIAPGMAVAAIGMLILTRLEVDSSYLTAIVPGLVVMGAGLGMVFAPALNIATAGVANEDAGVASAMVNVGQQVGGSFGTALLSTFAATAVTDYAAGHGSSATAQTLATLHGYTTAFWWSAGFFAFGMVVSWLLLPGGKPVFDPMADPNAAPALAH